jgi:hypothetical protein
MGTHSLLQLGFGGGSVWVRAAAAFQPAGDYVWLRPLPAKLALFADQRLVPRVAGELLADASSVLAGTSAPGAAP